MAVVVYSLSEFSMHAGALRVVVYEGQEAPASGRGSGRRVAVAAADLAAADVVRLPRPLATCDLGTLMRLILPGQGARA
jgi:hypothetical protein